MVLDLRYLRSGVDSGTGLILLIHGPMFAGKTEEFIGSLELAVKYGGLKVQAFKPVRDKRYGEDITTHDGKSFPTIRTSDSYDLKQLADPSADIYGISEFQFLRGPELEMFCLEQRKYGKVILLEGLLYDYKREPFEMGENDGRRITSTEFHEISDYDFRRFAACVDCKRPAAFTRRNVFVEGQVVVGGKELYSATCIDHHFIPKEKE
jgi:thymidine kinase